MGRALSTRSSFRLRGFSHAINSPATNPIALVVAQARLKKYASFSIPKYQNSHNPFPIATRVIAAAISSVTDDRQSKERRSERRPLGVTLKPNRLGNNRSNIERKSGKQIVDS